MNKAGLAFAALVCCLLLAYVTIINIFVLPTIQAMFAANYFLPSLPTRIAFLLADKGRYLLPVLVLAIVVVGGKRGKDGGGDAARTTALNGANLLLALCLVVQCAAWIDVAIAIPKIGDSRQHAAPAATQPAQPSTPDSARPPAR